MAITPLLNRSENRANDAGEKNLTLSFGIWKSHKNALVSDCWLTPAGKSAPKTFN